MCLVVARHCPTLWGVGGGHRLACLRLGPGSQLAGTSAEVRRCVSFRWGGRGAVQLRACLDLSTSLPLAVEGLGISVTLQPPWLPLRADLVR